MQKTIRLIVWLTAALLCVAMLMPAASLSAAAAGGKPAFETELFPHGISRPDAPYLNCIDNGPGSVYSGHIELWYTVPEELLNASEAYRTAYDEDDSEYSFTAFREKFGIENWFFYLQADVSVDGGAWHYNESWDRNEDVNRYGYTLPDSYYLGERITVPVDAWYYAMDADNAFWAEDDLAGAVKPYVNDEEETVYHFDLDNHTIAVRVRCLVQYWTLDAEAEETVYSYIISDWSPVTSIGKNDTQREPEMPASIPVPQISDFDIVEPEDGYGDPYLKWTQSNAADYVPGILWAKINGLGTPYFEAEMKVDKGDWQPVSIFNDGIANGVHTAYSSDQLHPGCHVEARFRVGSPELGYSDWSPVQSAGAELYCDHPSFTKWHECPDNPDVCQRECTECGQIETKWHYGNTPVVLKQPTCTTEGEKQYTCLDCGHKWTEPISTNDAHVWGAWVKKDAETCVRTCTLCKTATETQSHWWQQDLSRSTAATCGREGSIMWVCTDCHAERTEAVAKLTTHRWNLTGNEDSFWHSVGIDKPHERICPDCGLKETGTHSWDNGYVTQKATCAVEGVKTFSCTVCDAQKTQPIAKTTLHDYDKKWVSDEGGHWYQCKVCGSQVSYAVHTPGPAATEQSAQTCTVCHYVIHPVLEHTHQVTSGWTSDETGHWHYCTGCGEKSSFSAHTYDNDCDPTCNVCGWTRKVTHTPGKAWAMDGTAHWHVCDKCGAALESAAHVPGPAATEEKPQTCTVCGYIIRPALEHVHRYGDTYTYDATGHWFTCTGCSETKDFAAHVFDNDCDETCNICGYRRTANHKPAAAWSSDGQSHWHACSVCGTKLDTAVHAFDNACDADCNICGYIREIHHSMTPEWRASEETHYHLCTVCGLREDEAYHVYDDKHDADCNVCGYTRTVTHTYSEGWEYDDNGHWHVCTDCDAQSDKSAHVFDNACDATCNICGYTRSITHKFGTEWVTDDVNHWHECSVCGAHGDVGEHVGEPATADKDSVCTVCGHVIAKATGVWESDDNGHWSVGDGTSGSGDWSAHSFDGSGNCTVCGHHDPNFEPATEPATGAPVVPATEPVTDADTQPAEPATDADTAASGDGTATEPATAPEPYEPGTKPEPYEPLSETETDDGGRSGSGKCWLCGFCPCPLHICIFIWILIAIIIIVVILLIIFKKKDRKCPKCGEKLGKDAKVCPKCGASLEKAADKDEQK